MNKQLLLSVQSICLIVLLLVGTTVGNSFCTAITDEPTPPPQPPTGPGGSNYSHEGVRQTWYGWGGRGFWIFEPTDPTPESAPLIVFLHGWAAFRPFAYKAWIEHLVKRGNIVVYPRYQLGFYAGLRFATPNAIRAVQQAITILQQGDHVRPELDKFAIVGHSLGGGITAEMAVYAEQYGLPIPKAIMPVQAAPPSANLSLIPNSTLMIVIVGEDDTIAGDEWGKQIFYKADKIPLENKDFVIQVTDTYGTPDLFADHSAPLTPAISLGRLGKTDAMDYYSTWKLFDALTDYAFYGINGEYCLGNTSQQRFMGLWSDGTPVKELLVTDTP
jgi:pimeloyl-ACP methyl ester carboxylesterase